MDTSETKPGVARPAKRGWRRHSDEFKTRVIDLARQPGASTGMGDLSTKKAWEDLCTKYRMSRVRVWTLDDDLAGLDRAVVARRRVT